MPDRDKVVKCLEACTGEQNDCAGHTCPYWDFDGEVGCRTQMELDALALLKKQEAQKFFVDESGKITPLQIVFPNCPLKEYEAVEPTWQQGKAFCGSCGKRIPLKIGARYCHKCGQKVKWK